jgi:uncharacterized membrane protein YgcG
LHPRSLLILAFAILVCSAAAPASAQWCSHIEGMRVCDPSYPGTWAECVAKAHRDDCLAAGTNADQCWAEYYTIWYMEYGSASRDCDSLRQECRLQYGFVDSNGLCTRYYAGSGSGTHGGGGNNGGGDYGDGGGGGGGGGGGCHTQWLELQIDVGGRWLTIWEGWGQVCEDEM